MNGFQKFLDENITEWESTVKHLQKEVDKGESKQVILERAMAKKAEAIFLYNKYIEFLEYGYVI